MSCRSRWIQVDFIKGSRTFANLCWSCILVCGATGFLLVGFSSCVGKDLIPGLSSKQIVFIPQGIVMCFYGIAGLFLGLYLWCTVFWDVGSGYNSFDKREGISSIFPIYLLGMLLKYRSDSFSKPSNCCRNKLLENFEEWSSSSI